MGTRFSATDSISSLALDSTGKRKMERVKQEFVGARVAFYFSGRSSISCDTHLPRHECHGFRVYGVFAVAFFCLFPLAVSLVSIYIGDFYQLTINWLYCLIICWLF